MRRLPSVIGAVLLPQAMGTRMQQRQQRQQSLPAAGSTEGAEAMIDSRPAGTARVTQAQVWALWNEGNLFSLSLAQMQDFLQSVGVATDSEMKKAAAVRRIEAFLHSQDSGAQGLAGQPAAQQSDSSSGSGYGRYVPQGSALPPETLLDLAQAGFYGGAANMAPRAFQLLCDGASPDAAITRIHTAAFPGFPANTECYSFVPSDANVALRARLSKALQWCCLNMRNLQMDGELHVSLGKLLVDSAVVKTGTPVSASANAEGSSAGRDSENTNKMDVLVPAYNLQQRLQLDRPYTWVTAVPESAVGAAEAFLQTEGFALVAPAGKQKQQQQVTYDATIKRSQDTLHAELDAHGKLATLRAAWVDLQTAHHTRESGPDVRLLLRSRPPVRQVDVDTYSSAPIIELANDDVQDVLQPASGQLVYLSENETRRFERVDERSSGVVVAVTEVRRQPLIVLRDDEEDLRIEYSVSVTIPAGSGGGAHQMDVRTVGLDVFELANRFAAALTAEFEAAYGR